MRVLVACEESQEVCKAFREKGHEAYSCDIQHCALWNHMEWHIVEDVRQIIGGGCSFTTVDGKQHTIPGHWDLIIAHPPCTYLTSSSAVRLFNKDHTVKDASRLEKGWAAKDFFMLCYNAPAEKKCIENPTPMRLWQLPAWSQIIEPWMFGEPWRKRTCLWLQGLPELKPTQIVTPEGLWVGSSSKRDSKYQLKSNRQAKIRSKTFPGIARAMADQWG